MRRSARLSLLHPRTRLLQAAYGVRRRVGRAVEGLRGGGIHLQPRSAASLPYAECDFLKVVDGRSLHVHALVPAPVELLTGQADVLFIRDQSVLRTAARIRCEGGLVAVEAVAPLGDDAGELALTKGTWSLGIVVATMRGLERRFALRLDGPEDHDGPTVPAPPHPVTGRQYTPVRGAQGRAQIKVTEAKARVEVVRLATGSTEARIQARLVGVRSLDSPAVVFTPRGGGQDCLVPIHPIDGRFEFVVPLAQLASGPPGVEVIWEAWVRTSATRVIRLGRFLHDLSDPRTVLRVSRVTIPLDANQFVGYRPYYTKAGNLAVACLRFARFTGTDE